MKITWALTDTRRSAAVHFAGVYPLDVVEVIQPRAGNRTASAYISYPSNSQANIDEVDSYIDALRFAIKIAANWEAVYAGAEWQNVTHEVRL